jgi:hypothetical protein
MLLIISANSFAQEDLKPFYLELNIDKTLLAATSTEEGYPTRGFVLNLSGKVKLKKEAKFANFVIGYASVGQQNNIPNVEDYRCQGFFMKGGYEYVLSNPDKDIKFTLGTLLSTSFFKEEWDVFLEGDYFPDYRETFERRNLFAIGLELDISIWLPITPRFYINPGVSFNLSGIANTQNEENFSTQYIPGVGLSSDFVDLFRRPGSNTSVSPKNIFFVPSFNLSLMYAFGK